MRLAANALATFLVRVHEPDNLSTFVSSHQWIAPHQRRKAGTPIGGNDLLIAAQAVALDLTLVTENEFSRIAGLRIENWLRDY
jgi:predicted nucleic acid-binding protein